MMPISLSQLCIETEMGSRRPPKVSILLVRRFQ